MNESLKKIDPIQVAMEKIVAQLPQDVDVLTEIINDKQAQPKDRIAAIRVLNSAETKFAKHYKRTSERG